MCSILLWPRCGLAAAAQLSFVAALAVYELVSESLPQRADIALKWPNDVLVGGRKISGILLEAGGWMPGAPGWVVVGTGVNLRSHPTDTEWQATDLAAEGSDPPAPDRALESFCRAFEQWRSRWELEGFEPVRRAWLEHAHGLNGRVAARMEREMVTGRFAGIDSDGSIVLEAEDGTTRRISAAEIFPAAD